MNVNYGSEVMRFKERREKSESRIETVKKVESGDTPLPMPPLGAHSSSSIPSHNNKRFLVILYI
jgi:hypothetical protein